MKKNHDISFFEYLRGAYEELLVVRVARKRPQTAAVALDLGGGVGRVGVFSTRILDGVDFVAAKIKTTIKSGPGVERHPCSSPCRFEVPQQLVRESTGPAWHAFRGVKSLLPKAIRSETNQEKIRRSHAHESPTECTRRKKTGGAFSPVFGFFLLWVPAVE